MQTKRTIAKQTLIWLRIDLQAAQASKTLEGELGYRCEQSRAVALDLMIRLMGV